MIRMRNIALSMLLLFFLSLTVGTVVANDQPVVPFSAYGVARVSASHSFLGLIRISINSSGTGPFFVARIIISTTVPLDGDIVIDSVIVDKIIIPVSNGVLGSFVVLNANSPIGEIIAALPPALSPYVVKDPLGNTAFAADGGPGGGVSFVLKMWSGTVTGSPMSAVALVTAPVNSTVTITMY